MERLPTVREHAEHAFRDEHAVLADVLLLLAELGTADRPVSGTPEVDRVRHAILLECGGSLECVRRATGVAAVDGRELFLTAGLPNGEWPEILTAKVGDVPRADDAQPPTLWVEAHLARDFAVEERARARAMLAVFEGSVDEREHAQHSALHAGSGSLDKLQLAVDAPEYGVGMLWPGAWREEMRAAGLPVARRWPAGSWSEWDMRTSLRHARWLAWIARMFAPIEEWSRDSRAVRWGALRFLAGGLGAAAAYPVVHVVVMPKGTPLHAFAYPAVVASCAVAAAALPAFLSAGSHRT